MINRNKSRNTSNANPSKEPMGAHHETIIISFTLQMYVAVRLLNINIFSLEFLYFTICPHREEHTGV